MVCKICAEETSFVFENTVLNKYKVGYYQCNSCLFLQTENPFWLDEAYKSAITSLDLGLVYRNLFLAPIIKTVFDIWFNKAGYYLDYGGGYGLLVRMMRDRGLRFFRQDKFCENLFAKYFDLEDLGESKHFEAVTTFEVFEHLENPIYEIEKMMAYSKNILFTTDLIPDNVELKNWHYLVPEVGQHIALYHKKSLEHIAKKFNLNLCSNGTNIHLLTEKKIPNAVFKLVTNPRVARICQMVFFRRNISLLPTDYNYILNMLKSKI